MNRHETFERAVELLTTRTGRKPVTNAAKDTLIINTGGWIIWLVLLDGKDWESGAWSLEMIHTMRKEKRLLRVQDEMVFDMLLGELRGEGM